MSTYKYTQKLTPRQRRARAQSLAAQRNAVTLSQARENTYKSPTASAGAKHINDANIALKSAATVGDLAANVVIGALKSLEGIYDLGAGLVGTVGGIFSDGFRNDVQNHIKYDAVGSWIGDPLDRLFKDSYLEDSKAGQITEAVIQGVGQMLPAVAVSIATSGLASGTMASAGTATAAQIAEAASKAGQVAALTTMGVSAAGNATEEAYIEGADYGEGLAYGTLTGAVEMGTEKLGGLTKNLYGSGALEKLGKAAAKETAEAAAKSSAKVGAKRVIKGMVEEGAEEALSELASPALKSIYKGKDATKEYFESEYWAGVGESALVGSLTSAVYGGTVGKIRGLGGASGIENDANAVLEDITEQKRRARKLAAKGKLTREQAINIEKTVKADMELLEKQLIKASDKSRAKALEGGLSLNFDEKGNLRPEIREILDNNIAAAADTTYDHRYRSIDLDADTITKTLERTGTTAFSGEMDAEQKANFNEFTRMFNAASDRSGGTMRFIVTNEMTNDNAMWVNDKGIMMISADTLRSGDSTTLLAQKLISDTFIESTVHEVKHAIDGTHSSSLLDEHLMSNDDVYNKAISEYLARGYSEEYLGKNRAKAAEALKDIVERGRAGKQLSANERAVFEEFEREWPAFASQQVLGTKEFARHLVKNDLGTVEKLLGKLQDIKKMLKSRENPDAKKAADFVKKAEQLYINALEEIGAKYVDNKIIGVNDKENDKEEEKFLHSKKLSANTAEKVVVEIAQNEELTQRIATSNKSKYDIIRRYLIEEFGGYTFTLSDGRKAIMDNSDAKELSHNATDKKTRHLGDLKQLVEKAAPHHSAFDVEHPKFTDFHYYTVTAKYAGEEIDLWINVGVAKNDGKNHIYSITNKIEDAPTHYGVGGPVGNHLQNASSNSSIPQTEKKSIPFEKKFSDNIQHSHKASSDTDAEDTLKIKGSNKILYETKEKTATKDIINLSDDSELANRVDNVHGAEKYKIIQAYILEALRDQPVRLSDGKTAIVDNRDALHISNKAGNVKTAQISKIKEIIEKATFCSEDTNVKHNKFNYFCYYKTKVQFENSIYPLYLNVGRGINDGKYHIYDITKKIRDTAGRINGLERPKPNEGYALENGISNSSISQIDEKSIPYEKKVSDNIQHSRKPTAQEGLNKQADYWRNEYNRANEQIKIRGRILSVARKIKDLKTGAYVNAAQYKSDIFKHTVEELGRIEFRGNFNNTGTRSIIKNLNEWYDEKNNFLYRGADASSGAVGRFNSEIKQMMSAIADGKGAFTTRELLSVEKILSYFAGEIQNYNTIIRNGKRVDAKPIAERHVKTAEEAQAIKIKCGAVRAISRSPFAVMVADPATLMRQADGYRNGFFTETFNELREGEIKSSVAEAELTNEFREFWNKNKAYGKRYNKATVKFNEADIPLRHAISLYMTYQRKQAQAGLVYSGFDILDGDKKITVYKGNDTKLTDKQIADISKKRANELKAQFNEKDLELVSVMERAFEECRKLKIDVDMALKYYTNVDNSDYYFPIRRSQIAQNIDMFSVFEGDRVSNLSMNKDIVKGAKNALLIEPVDIVFMRHIKATSLYSGLGIFTDNFNRLYNLNVNATETEKELSFEVKNDVKKSFGFNSINDYIGVRKAVISTLSSEGFFDNNVIVNKDSGMEIEITKDGIKETLGSDMRFEKLPRKLKELKLLTLRILPTMIEKAKLTDSDVNNIHTEQSKLKYSYLSQEITVSNGTHKEKYTISIAVRKSQQKNKFWIHEIRATKKEQNLIPSGDISPQQGYNEVRAPISIISLDGAFVNSKIENSDYNRPKTIKSTLESDKFSKTMTEYFAEIKKDIEGISTKEQSTRFFNDAVGYIRSAYAKYQLGANPKVWFTQFSSFFAATNILDYNSIIKTFGVKNKASEVDKYCRLAWLRNMDNTAVKAQSVTDKIGKIGDVLTAPIGWMDRFVVTELFGACQIQVQKDQKLAVGTEENKRAAGELLQKVILETQQNSLASERSAMMRSDDNLKKSFTMFSADSMKIFSRTVDAFGEREVIRTLIKNESNTERRAEYEAQLKKADKSCIRSLSALTTTSIFVAAIAQGFKWWYRKNEVESLGTFTADVIGNMLGGLPIIRDVYSYFADGYEMDNFLISTFNDVLKASLETWELSADIVGGKDVSQQEIASSVKKMLYASGQILGIPARNVYNFTTGNINRFFPATGYKIENIFYKQAYRADLAKAIENGDDNMISTIAGLILNENVGGIDSKAARTELDRLIGAGFDVLPRGISSTVTYNGEIYELSAKQKKAFSKVYGIANDALGDMVKLARYKEASDEVKASAVKYLYNTYYNLAIQNCLGEDLETKTVLFAEAIDIEKLALIIASAQYITADTDNKGKAISGSRKRKIQAYINSLSLKAAEKYMIMGYLGYKNINGEAQVKAYINTLNLTKQEKIRLLEYSGYTVA